MSHPTTPPKQTLDQRRARHAWEAVQEVVNSKMSKDAKGKYGIQARKLPTRIMAAGLGQALAFLKAKNYAPDLLRAVAHWVLEKRSNPDSPQKPQDVKDDALLRRIVEGDADFLRLATDETLAYLLWLNRFAEAEKLTEEN